MGEKDLSALKESAVSASVHWAKSGFGWFTMRDRVNDYIEALGVNTAIDDDQEAILHGRRAAALAINISAIHALTKQEELKLNEALIGIAQQIPRTQHRGFHR